MTRTPPIAGVLGGTFDPVHFGHLGIAEYVLRSLDLPRLLLLPSAFPPHKDHRDLTAASHRETMLRLAVEERPGLEICTVELERGEVCYTIDTLRELRRGANPLDPVFIVGMDSLLDFPTWRDFEDLVREFDLAVVDRPDQRLAEAKERLHPAVARRILSDADAGEARQSLGRGGRIFHLPMPAVRVSSSAIRALASIGLPLDGLVPPAVAGYIHRNGLYRQEDEP